MGDGNVHFFFKSEETDVMARVVSRLIIKSTFKKII